MGVSSKNKDENKQNKYLFIQSFVIQLQKIKRRKFMKNNKEVDIVQHEKLKLHIKYIIVIAVALLFGGIVLATSNQNKFVSQISFGSTMTSIILSVIAIWMSISGERTTNDIKSKISYSADRLSETTEKIEILNNNHTETLDKQLSELKDVKEQLSKIIQSVNHMEEQVSFMYNKKTAFETNTQDNNMSDTNKNIKLFCDVYSWATNNEHFQEFLFCKIAQVVIQKNIDHIPFSFNEIMSYLTQSGINTYYFMSNINAYWGIINTLLAASVFNDNEATRQILQIINNKLNVQSPPL